MQLLSQPNIVQARRGLIWLPAGFALFMRQPFSWIAALFLYWGLMLLCALIPVMGIVLPLILSPGLSLGFIEVARAIDERRTASPKLLLQGFMQPHTRGMIVLGLWYGAEIAAIVLTTMIFDDGLLMQWLASGTIPSPEEISQVRLSAMMALALYLPVMMAFWFAPQLVAWSDFAPTKALFFSFFAVWRNRAAFIRYLLTWIGVTVMIGTAAAVIGQLTGATQNTMTLLLFPVTLILMSAAHGSFYLATKEIFTQAPVSPPTTPTI